MCREDKLPITDFFELCRNHLHRLKYKLLVLLISRKADAPTIFRELRENWTSFRDLTNRDNVLFAFVGDNLNEINSNSYLIYRYSCKNDRLSRDSLYRFYTKEAIVNNSTFKICGDYHIRVGTIPNKFKEKIIVGKPNLNSSDTFESSHSLEINRIASHLKIPEQSIPCLSITELHTGRTDFVEVNPNLPLYPTIKKIVINSSLIKVKPGVREEIGGYRSYYDNKISLLRRELMNLSTLNGFKRNFTEWCDSWKNKPQFVGSEDIHFIIAFLADFNPEEIDTALSKLEELESLLPKSKKYVNMIKSCTKSLNKKRKLIKANRVIEIEKEIELLTNTKNDKVKKINTGFNTFMNVLKTEKPELHVFSDIRLKRRKGDLDGVLKKTILKSNNN